LGQQEVYIHAERDKNVHIKNNNGIFVGNDRSEKIVHDEKIEIGNDRIEIVGNDEEVKITQDGFFSIGRNQTINIGKDRTEKVGNSRYDQTTVNHTIEIGGNVEHTIQGHHRLEVGKAIEQKTTRFILQASQSLFIEGPGGSICIDANGITLNGVMIHIKGPTELVAAGDGNTLAVPSSVNTGKVMDQFCGLRADGICLRIPCNCTERSQ
ncbi:bacteriophage T4 gp5 trimerisation domain-containing protein, partial [Pseudomonas sp. GW456-12-1-14-TSB6]